ncbi:hypothetical protein DCM91_20220 [Chitinophaga costaii]|nr:hypothetical protein DCM91_20220 [Chitinophaga costaii]
MHFPGKQKSGKQECTDLPKSRTIGKPPATDACTFVGNIAAAHFAGQVYLFFLHPSTWFL